jgi:hypothetical protein
MYHSEENDWRIVSTDNQRDTMGSDSRVRMGSRRNWRTAHGKTQEDRMKYFKAERAVIKNIATSGLNSNGGSSQKQNERNTNIEEARYKKLEEW